MNKGDERDVLPIGLKSVDGVTEARTSGPTLQSPLGDPNSDSTKCVGPGGDILSQEDLSNEEPFCDPSRPPLNLCLPPNFCWVFLHRV